MNLQYSQSPKKQVIADVYLSQSMDSIIIFPSIKSERNYIRSCLREVLPGIKLKISNGGINISPQNAFYLKDKEIDVHLKWSSEAKQFVEKKQEIQKVYTVIKNNLDEIKEKGVSLAIDTLEGMDISSLDNHQVVNVAAMTIPNGFGLCVFDEQGAGKTVTSIYAYDVLVEKDEIDIALIIAPKSMVGEWPKDIKQFKGDLYKVETISGSSSAKRASISSNADIFVTNYETTVNMEAQLTALLRKFGKRSVLIVDESFFIKNPDSKRTQSLRKLRTWCGRAFVLCGTPAPNSPSDLVEQFNFVDMGTTFDAIKIPDDRQEALPVVRSAINKRGLYVRNLKQDVLPNLPDKHFHTLYVPLAPEQKEIYQKTLQGYINELKSTDEKSFRKQLTHFLAKRSVLLQICSNPSSIVTEYEEIPSKLLVIDNILEDLINVKGEKVIIWSFYRKSIDILCSRYSKYNPVRYDGSVSSIEERKIAVNSFQQEDSEVRLFIGNPAAAGAGLTLHSARYAIYESFSDQAAQYLQSLDRIHRRGQARDVEYIILITEKTIEVKQYDTLKSKEGSARDLLGDVIKEPVSRELLLSEAINASKELDLTLE